MAQRIALQHTRSLKEFSGSVISALNPTKSFLATQSNFETSTAYLRRSESFAQPLCLVSKKQTSPAVLHGRKKPFHGLFVLEYLSSGNLVCASWEDGVVQKFAEGYREVEDGLENNILLGS